MADKKLEDYMNELQDYAKTDAHQKKKEYQESFKTPFVFPWTKVIFGVLIAVSIFHNFIGEKIDDLSKLEFVQDLQKAGKKMSSVKISLTTDEEKPAAPSTETANAIDPAFAPVNAPGAAANTATHASSAAAPETPPGDDMVKVEGQWMKRSPDNIYIIKGKRVLYIDDRRNRK